MKIAIRLQIEVGDGGPCDEEILSLDKPHDQLERVVCGRGRNTTLGDLPARMVA